MASTAAFNALLKLIEEPPGHVLFAMATTDPQKVLPTILSRVQRLDLRRVGAADVAGRVRDLVQREGGSIDDAAVDLVVRAGDGSVRDTESVLEQVLSYADGEVTGGDVAEVLGQTTFEHTADAVDAVVAGDLAGAFAKVQDLLDDGTDLRQFTLDLVGHVRDLLVLVVAPNRPDLVDATADRRDGLVAQAARMDRDALTGAVDELATALEQMRQGPARLALELALARIATRPGAPRPTPATEAPVEQAAATPPGQPTAVPADPTTTADPAPDDVAEPDRAAADDNGPERAQEVPDAEGDEDATEVPVDDAEPDDAEPDDESEPDDEPGSVDDVSAEDDDASDVETTGDDPAGEVEADDAQGTVESVDPERSDESEGAEDVPEEGVDADVDAEPGGGGPDEASAGDESAASGDTDFATRADARAQRVARDGLPDVPQDRPAGPEVEVAEPPSRDDDQDLERIRARWDAILELVRAESKRSHAIFERARVLSLRNGVLALGYGQRYKSFHATNAVRSEFADDLRGAIEQAAGVSVTLDVRVDGDGPRRPQPRPVDDPGDDPGDNEPGASAATPGRDDHAAPSTPDDPAPRGSTAGRGPHDLGDEAGEPPTATPTPLANLDPAEAMDRAAAAVIERLGATEIDPGDA